LPAYTGLLPAGSFSLLISFNLVALTPQSALMPLGDTITLAAPRSEDLDYGPHRSSDRDHAKEPSPPLPRCAVMEVTKRLKPSSGGSRIGDRASVPIRRG
jgi:hypothetical protein